MRYLPQLLIATALTLLNLGCSSDSNDSPLVPEIISIAIVDANETLQIHALPLIDINGDTLDLEQRQLLVTISYTEGPDTTDANELDWESNDTSVITVHNGLLTAVANHGAALISASYRDILYTTQSKRIEIIPLTETNITSDTIFIENNSSDVNTSSSYTLFVNGTFEDNKTSLKISSNAAWSSSNTTVAIVDFLNGTVTTLDEGNSTIEVSVYDEINSSLELNVTIP